MTKENSEPNKFFTQIKQLTHKFAEEGTGKININIQSQPLGKSKREYKVYAPNLIPSFAFFPSENLKDCLSQSHPPIDEKAFIILKESMLNILNAGGFGQVQLIFQKNKKEETIIFCEVTISQKHVVSSV